MLVIHARIRFLLSFLFNCNGFKLFSLKKKIWKWYYLRYLFNNFIVKVLDLFILLEFYDFTINIVVLNISLWVSALCRVFFCANIITYSLGTQPYWVFFFLWLTILTWWHKLWSPIRHTTLTKHAHFVHFMKSGISGKFF